jgi:hypothetical protein
LDTRRGGEHACPDGQRGVNSIFIEQQATLDVGPFDLAVYGGVLAQGAIIGTGRVVLSDQATVAGTIPTLVVNHDGTSATAGDLTINGNLIITAGAFQATPQTIVTVAGNVDQQQGSLIMEDGSNVTVQGNFTAMGGGGQNQLTGGRLELRGNLTVGANAPFGFSPSGTHQTVFNGSQIQTVTLDASDSTTQRLNVVSILNTAQVRFVNETHVVGDFLVAGVMETLSRLELWDQATFSQTATVRYGGQLTGSIIAFSYLWSDVGGVAGPIGQNVFFRDQQR